MLIPKFHLNYQIPGEWKWKPFTSALFWVNYQSNLPLRSSNTLTDFPRVKGKGNSFGYQPLLLSYLLFYPPLLFFWQELINMELRLWNTSKEALIQAQFISYSSMAHMLEKWQKLDSLLALLHSRWVINKLPIVLKVLSVRKLLI